MHTTSPNRRSRLLRNPLTLVLLALCSSPLAAQERPAEAPREDRGDRGPGRGPGGPGGRENGFLRMHPLMVALDANGDGVIDAAELANATAALRKLDKNNDGKLTEDEIRPASPRGRGPGGPGGVNAEDLTTRMMQFDKNGDGKLSKDELPERMQAMMERGDTDKDGFLSKDELRKLAQQQAESAGRGERRPQGEGRQ